MNLGFLKEQNKALVDLLAYATLIKPGIVQTKDGGLIAGFYFRGFDQSILTNEERNALASRLNDKLKILEGGWTLHVDLFREKVSAYPSEDKVFFPDLITKKIDDERREQYEFASGGDYYVTKYAAILHWLPPKKEHSFLEKMLYSKDDEKTKTLADELLHNFAVRVDEFARSIADIVSVELMLSKKIEVEGQEVFRDDLIDYLDFCISGEKRNINLTSNMPFLDGVLGRYDLVAGLEPIINGKSLTILTIDGFPDGSYPGILSALEHLPFEYRWSTRFIYLDNEVAKAELNRFRRKWDQKKRGFTEQILNTGKGAVDQDAVRMVDQTDDALSEISSQVIKFGFYTSTILFFSENEKWKNEASRDLVSMIRDLGFSARIEKVNCMESYLGSLPGHGFANIRRPLVTTYNLSDFLPTSAVFNGEEFCPCDKFPPKSPALLYASTYGASPYRFNLHVADVGHTLIIGPTGSGKSTLLALIAAQFRKYKGAKVFSFDKGYSMFCLAHAVKGDHYDLGNDKSLQFAPLAALRENRNWLENWLMVCCQLQLNEPLNPKQREYLHETIVHFSNAGDVSRSLSDFVSQLQDETLRSALTHYTLSGSVGHFLDGEDDGLELSNFTCFELEELMSYKDEDRLPVLLYIFNRIEKALDGSPSVIILDEAWLMLGHPVFRDKLVEWLKVLRKLNCSVVMATQSLSDAVKSGVLDVIVESTSTKVFLPNPSALSEVSRPVYEQIGLNRNQIEVISRITPKQQYFAMSADGSRLFDLSLGKVALSFVGQSGVVARDQILKFMDEYGDEWAEHWEGVS